MKEFEVVIEDVRVAIIRVTAEDGGEAREKAIDIALGNIPSGGDEPEWNDGEIKVCDVHEVILGERD